MNILYAIEEDSCLTVFNICEDSGQGEEQRITHRTY